MLADPLAKMSQWKRHHIAPPGMRRKQVCGARKAESGANEKLITLEACTCASGGLFRVIYVAP